MATTQKPQQHPPRAIKTAPFRRSHHAHSSRIAFAWHYLEMVAAMFIAMGVLAMARMMRAHLSMFPLMAVVMRRQHRRG